MNNEHAEATARIYDKLELFSKQFKALLVNELHAMFQNKQFWEDRATFEHNMKLYLADTQKSARDFGFALDKQIEYVRTQARLFTESKDREFKELNGPEIKISID